MIPWVEGRLDWSALSRGDIGEIAALTDACAYLDDVMELTASDDLYGNLDLADDLESNGVVGRDASGTIVAWGWLRTEFADDQPVRGWLHWGVHPAFRYQHIEKQTVKWLTDRALEWWQERPDLATAGRAFWAGAFTEAKLGTRVAALEFNGYTDERWFCDMHLDLTQVDSIAPSEPTGGLRIVPFDRASHSRAVLAAHNAVFGPMRDAQEVLLPDWERSLDAPTTRLDWSFVALDGDQVVGYALNSLPELGDWSEGWTDRIGVLPSHRRHGVGEALLRASLGVFVDAGLDHAGLGVDTERPEDALRLFTRMGYTQSDAVVLYGRHLA